MQFVIHVSTLKTMLFPSNWWCVLFPSCFYRITFSLQIGSSSLPLEGQGCLCGWGPSTAKGKHGLFCSCSSPEFPLAFLPQLSDCSTLLHLPLPLLLMSPPLWNPLPALWLVSLCRISNWVLLQLFAPLTFKVAPVVHPDELRTTWLVLSLP